MSQIKTTEIEGDVAIGRHVTAGGNATIQGNTTVKKNLKVEGWLDARNIKGPNKGIFLDVTKLREAYPLPHDGWWALVGDTLPAPLYIADGGAWVATGESAGNPTIDCQQYNDAVAALDADLKELAKDVSANAQSIEQIRTQINTLTSDVSGLKNRVSNAETRISTAEGNIQSINNSKGMPNGIAVLDPDGLIAKEEIPTSLRNVIPFDGFYSFDTAPTLQYAPLGESEASIFYCRATKTFIACYKSKYYPGWPDADHFGTSTLDGRTPVKGKIYVDAANKTSYAWDGSDLVVVGYNLELGEEANQAYPGTAGAALAAAHDTLNTRVNNIHVVPFSGTYNPSGHVMPKFGAWWVPSDEGGTFMVTTLGIAGYTADDYNDTEGNPRTDRLFRHGATLYRVVDGQLVEYGTANAADIAVAKRQVFVDMWNSACGIYGKYNADTGYFELNGLVDITYKEAVLIYANRRHLSLDNHGFYSSSTARTNLLPSTQNGLFGYTRSLEYSFSSCKNMEVIRLAPNTLTVYSSMVRTFHTCVKLRKILGAINVLQKPNLTEAFALCPLLEEVQIKGLTKDLSFSDSPLLSLDSLSYLVAQSAASNPITVTVHPEVYAKLTGDTSNAAVQALTVEELAQWQALVATAQQKKISFATTTNS